MSNKRNNKAIIEEARDLNQSFGVNIQVEESNKNGTLIYFGPTLKEGILQQNSVFRGELPQYLHEIRSKHPVIGELFVSPQEFGAVSKKINVQGTREYQLFQQAVLVAKGGSN